MLRHPLLSSKQHRYCYCWHSLHIPFKKDMASIPKLKSVAFRSIVIHYKEEFEGSILSSFLKDKSPMKVVSLLQKCDNIVN